MEASHGMRVVTRLGTDQLEQPFDKPVVLPPQTTRIRPSTPGPTDALPLTSCPNMAFPAPPIPLREPGRTLRTIYL